MANMYPVQTNEIKHIFIKDKDDIVASIFMSGLGLTTTDNLLVVGPGIAEIRLFDINRHETSEYFYMNSDSFEFEISKLEDNNINNLSQYIAINFPMEHIEIQINGMNVSNAYYKLYPIRNFSLVKINDNPLLWSVI